MARLLWIPVILIAGLLGLGLVGGLIYLTGQLKNDDDELAKIRKYEATEGLGRINSGTYAELTIQDEQNPKFIVKVEEVTPNIIFLSGMNGWVTFASYDDAKKEYRGFFEWKTFGPERSPGGKWADLYEVRVIKLDGNMFVMTGKSKKNELLIRGTPYKTQD